MVSEITRMRSGSDVGASSQGFPAAKVLDIPGAKLPMAKCQVTKTR
jgi:hypothetical protein